MRPNLLNHYNSELHYIRQMAVEFAQAHPKIAGRLGLDAGVNEFCPDPFVERLIEGFAYLTARVQTKFDAEFPRLSQSLLESVFPHYLAPTPSMLIAGFEPETSNPALATGHTIPRGTRLRGNLSRGTSVPAQYRTAHEVTLWPLRITEASYTARDIGAMELPAAQRPKAVLRLRFELTADVPLEELQTDELDVFLRGDSDYSNRMYEQIFAHGTGVAVRAGVGRQRRTVFVAGTGLRPVGFSEQEALLPPAPRTFEGYRLLREYFVFPQRFLFFKLCGLREALRQVAVRESGVREFEVLVLFDSVDTASENRVDESMFALHCTPAVNLFEKRLDRTRITDRKSEYQVIADRTHATEFEIYDLVRVDGIGSQADDVQHFTPFYYNHDRNLHARAYYTLHRVPRTLSARERQQGGVRYAGSEVYLSLVDGNHAPFPSDLQQLSISALCTNRHLPLQMPVGVGRTDFHLEVNAPSTSVRALTTPTEPIPSLAEGDLSWRLISHLSLNYLSLLDAGPEEGAVALREILRLYGEHPDNPQAAANLNRMLDGLLSVTSEPIIRRVPTPGPIAFARGLEIKLTTREADFSGSSVFLLGAVLARFFAKYVSINSFTETVLCSERGEIKRWAATPGRRDLL